MGANWADISCKHINWIQFVNYIIVKLIIIILMMSTERYWSVLYVPIGFDFFVPPYLRLITTEKFFYTRQIWFQQYLRQKEPTEASYLVERLSCTDHSTRRSRCVAVTATCPYTHVRATQRKWFGPVWV